MARELMPKSGILMPYVVVTRDAAVVGVSTVDGFAGAIDLTQKYLTIDHANRDWLTKTEGASKAYVGAALAPIMEGALFKNDPYINNNTPIRSGGANGVESVDMIKVTDKNVIKIGSYESSVQGIELHSAGRVSVVDKNAGGVETKYPIYSQRYRPEVSELPFAAIGSYVKDAQGRTIGVNRTGVNADITQMTQKVTFTQPPTVPDAAQPYDAVNLRQLQAAGDGGGANITGVMNNFIGAIEWFNGTRAKLPAGYIAADGDAISKTAYPDLWAAVKSGLLNSVSEVLWQNNGTSNFYGNRGKYSVGSQGIGDDVGLFRAPDLNGFQSGSLPHIFLSSLGKGSSESSGFTAPASAPQIIGTVSPLVWQANGVDTSTGAFSGITVAPNLVMGTTGAASFGQTQYTLDASRSSPAYSRTDNEIVPNSAYGIWIIRANGSFTAAGTRFSTISSDATMPPSGTALTGGLVASEYKVADKMKAEAILYSYNRVGTADAIAHIDSKLYDDSGVLSQASSFKFHSGGAFEAPNSIQIGPCTWNGTKWLSGAVNASFHVMYPDNTSSPGMYVKDFNGGGGYASTLVVDKNYQNAWVSGTSFRTTQYTSQRGSMGFGQLWSAAALRVDRFTATNGAANFLSIAAAAAVTANLGFNGGVSYGMFTPGNNQFPMAQISVAAQDADVSGNFAALTSYRFDSIGEFQAYTPTTAYSFNKTAISDRERKRDIVYVSGKEVLEGFSKIKPATFIYKDDEQERVRSGVIAQDLEEINPLYVKTKNYMRDTGDEWVQKELDTNALLVDALVAIKVLSDKVKSLEEALANK